MTHKILITDGLAQSGQAILQEHAQVDDRTGIPKDELLKTIGAYDALIVRSRTKVNPDVFAAAERLKVVGRAGVGVDNIHLPTAAARGVTVVNAPTASSAAVAELALGMMYALARFIPRADSAMKNGQWTKKQLRGTELGGKTLGIVGVGRIGSAVGRLARAVGMHTVGYDPYLPPEEIRQRGTEPLESAQAVYQRADYLTFHVPLTDETRGTVNTATFAQMKSGVRLVCTARGGVIDEADLLTALESGQVAGAALDVFAQEPPGLTALVAHPNVVATPHVGAQTAEAQDRVAADIASEVLNVLQEKPLRWKV